MLCWSSLTRDPSRSSDLTSDPSSSSHLTRRSCILLQIACCSCLTLLGRCAGLRGRGLELALVLDGGDVDYGEVDGEYGVRKVKIFCEGTLQI